MIDLVPYLPEYLPGIGLFYAAFLLSALSPGPNILAVMGTSIGAGRKAGTVLALGIFWISDMGVADVCPGADSYQNGRWDILALAGL